MTQHAYEPLPRLKLLLPQRLADVRQHKQRVWPAILPKRSASHLPAPGTSRKRDIHRTRRRTFQRLGQPRLRRRPPQQSLGGLTKKTLAGAVDEAQSVGIVEREHSDVDLRHHGAEQRRRLHGAEALRSECFAEQVRLEKRESQGVVAVGAARTD